MRISQLSQLEFRLQGGVIPPKTSNYETRNSDFQVELQRTRMPRCAAGSLLRASNMPVTDFSQSLSGQTHRKVSHPPACFLRDKADQLDSCVLSLYPTLLWSWSSFDRLNPEQAIHPRRKTPWDVFFFFWSCRPPAGPGRTTPPPTGVFQSGPICAGLLSDTHVEVNNSTKSSQKSNFDSIQVCRLTMD